VIITETHKGGGKSTDNGPIWENHIKSLLAEVRKWVKEVSEIRFITAMQIKHILAEADL
jgi:hypothetical protein